MSNQERLSPPQRLGESNSLIANTLQMEHNHQVLAKHITAIKRQLDELAEQFNNRPELQQIANLEGALAEEQRQSGEQSPALEIPVEVTQIEVTDCVEETPQLIHVQSYEYQLVFDRSRSRSVLREALCESQERLIIVCPWLNQNSIDADMLQLFRDCLNRNCRIDIGWGYLSERSRLGVGWRYNALKDLRQLEQDYPDKFKLKLLGTHEKFLVCDRAFAMLGSHNLLTSSAQSAEREAGIRTTDPQIIQGLINRFDGAEVQDAQAVDETLRVGSQSSDDAEALDALDICEEPYAILLNFDDGETDQDTGDSDEDSQEPAIDAEEFLRRHNSKEQDFTGINLARVDLTGKKLGRDNLNLSKANLTRAKLGKAKLDCINLSGANLRGAELCEAQLHQTNLSEANLKNADLRKVNLYGTKLGKANLSNANLSGVNLSLEVHLDLNEVNFSGANLSRTNLRQVNLNKVDLSNANLSNANLFAANLEGTNLQGVNLQQALYNAWTIFPSGFDPLKAGAYLIAPDVSLQKANLAGADLMNAQLSGANLSGTNLVRTNLSGAALIQANLNGSNLSKANLDYTNLTAADLRGANLMQANLNGTILTAADLSGSNLKNAAFNNKTRLSGANLSSVNLAGQNIQKINMSGVNMSDANLCGAWLCFSNLSGANLTSADLRGADLGYANLEKANLRGAKLSGADLVGAKLSGAIMPDGTTHE